ncbi:phosphoethanolamine transferase [Avibacterium gallinarum]|uniref:Lipid A ethanolaminephosphotransferase n=1 Tax=Avibacterium gallinarum TaxID=755 RepID=A0A379AU86_AVIGA|nr:phosphoethanolamine--lipid A transferase [Avibacterium gallinarum]POY44019.1 phosphoethanolamine transferase [Avibacterium gallinarum]TDP29602.1 lipid A ethanolaminephosphotransferase [Avibacterium gallinarum]SUB25819.1 phosphoethanolamine transferase EptA [Avibacterium gallinarum]
MLFSRFKLKSSTLIALVALYFTLVLNIAFYKKVWALHPFAGQPEDYFLLTVPIFIFFTLNAVFQLFALPILHKVIIPLLLIISAAIGYQALFYDVHFTTDMLENVLQTTPAESVRMLTWQYLAWIAFFGMLPAILYIIVKVDYRTWWKELGLRVGLIALSGVVIWGIAKGFYQDYAAFVRNNKPVVSLLVPSNFISAGVNKVKRVREANRPYEQIGLDAQQAKPDEYRHFTVIVVGETTRAQNWGLNGYARQTTPKLAARGKDIINFTDVSSCGTSTAISVPCMFSYLTQAQYNGGKAQKMDNLLDVLQRADVNIFWLDNNSDCKGVCLRVPNEVTNMKTPEYCTDGECLDEILLKDFDKILNESQKDTVLILHTIGSHGPTYYERYTPEFKKFVPTCDTNEIQTCSNEQLVNTYDNGILYIDNFLDQVIQKLEHRDDLESAVYYVSDHGESLGEDGIYLHGTPYAIAPDYQIKVPMFFWFSKTWQQNEGVDLDCLRHNASAQHYSHDNLFSTVIGMMDMNLKTDVYQKDLDILASCKKAH